MRTSTIEAARQVRRDLLRDYLIEIAKDLVARGIVKRRQGQSLDSIIVEESQTVMMTLSEDLAVVSMGFLKRGAEIANASSNPLGKLLNLGLQLLVEQVK